MCSCPSMGVGKKARRKQLCEEEAWITSGESTGVLEKWAPRIWDKCIIHPLQVENPRSTVWHGVLVVSLNQRLLEEADCTPYPSSEEPGCLAPLLWKEFWKHPPNNQKASPIPPVLLPGMKYNEQQLRHTLGLRVKNATASKNTRKKTNPTTS